MRKILLSLFALYLFFIPNMINVNAGLKTDYEYLNDGFNEGKYLDVCEYKNTVDSDYNIITIYYVFETKQMRVSFYKHPNVTIITDFALNEGKIYTQDELFSKENSSCPKYAFVNFTGGNELCFSSDKDYCLSIEGALGIGKKFHGKSQKKYDFADQIKIYYSDDDNYFYDVSCDNFDLDSMKSKLITDFSKNFLNGNSLPLFIENNPDYINYKNAQEKEITSFLKNCKEEIINNDNYTDSQKKEELSKLDYSDNDISKMLESVDAELKSYSNFNYQNAGKLECAGLLGSVTNPDEPAYYISMSFNIIKYLATIFLIVFTIVDYIKAVVSKDDEELSKTNAKFVKRFIFAIIIFVLPSLIIMVLEWGGLINDPSICGI